MTPRCSFIIHPALLAEDIGAFMLVGGSPTNEPTLLPRNICCFWPCRYITLRSSYPLIQFGRRGPTPCVVLKHAYLQDQIKGLSVNETITSIGPLSKTRKTVGKRGVSKAVVMQKRCPCSFCAWWPSFDNDLLARRVGRGKVSSVRLASQPASTNGKGNKSQ
jgi:hypothetical protein